MATTVRSILNRATTLLNDQEHVRYAEAELLEWLNDGQRATAKGPATDVYVVRGSVTAVAGTVQTLPENSIRLVDVVKENTTGGAIHQSDYATVDALSNVWRAAAAGPAEVYFFDERNPKQFEVYPPQAGGEQIQVVYQGYPADALINGVIGISDMYADSLIDYIVYRGLSKDTEDASQDLARATAFYRAFLVSIGYKESIDDMIQPRRS